MSFYKRPADLPEQTDRKGFPKDRSPEEPTIILSDDLPLVNWIPAVLPNGGSPWHLEPFPSYLDRAVTEPMRILCSCPIRHWKSGTIKSWVAKVLRKYPRKHFIIMTHGHDFAQSYGREVRELCRSLGVRISRGHDTILDWTTEEGGGVYIMSNKQSALGRPCDYFIFDDPFASFEEAENIDIRDHVDFVITQYTARLNPGGSVIGIMSRLHPDDAIGRRLARQSTEWLYVHHQAVYDEGAPAERSLRHDIMSLEHLNKVRAELQESDPTEKTWWSQFQNDPREQARGSFKGSTYFSGELDWRAIGENALPKIIGVDAAFSVNKPRDWFAAMTIVETHVEEDGRVLPIEVIVDVRRHQRGTIAVGDTLKDLRFEYPDARMTAYASGPEIGVYHQLAHYEGIIVEIMSARWNKEYRARPTAAAWERKTIRILPNQKWERELLRELHQFTGAENGMDDQTDCMVAAHDGMRYGKGKPPIGLGRGPYRT